jgi:transcriptional regulator with GAF, ATPase, and Fis domain
MAREGNFTTTTQTPDDEISQLYRILDRANEIASNTELDDLLDQMLDLIIEVCGGNAGTLYLLDSEHGELEFKVIRGPNSDQNLIGKRIKTDLGIVGATMGQVQPLVIEDLVNDRVAKVSGSSEGCERYFPSPVTAGRANRCCAGFQLFP